MIRFSMPRPARTAALLSGPLIAAMIWFVLPEAWIDAGGSAHAFTRAGRGTACLGAWMAVWWMTEAIPIAATALLPLALLPILGPVPIRQVASPYAHELIFLFLGGFVLARAMEKWGLHRRIAIATIRMTGTRPRNIVGGFMLATAMLSMWVSNTATAMMMLPIAMSVVDLVARRRGEESAGPAVDDPLAIGLLLGIAYGASIGGLGTLIGTPPNLFLASYARDHLGVEIGFARWMLIGVPLVALLLPAAWLLITRILHPVGSDRIEGVDDLIERTWTSLGPMSRGEMTVLGVFLVTAVTWILRPVLVGLTLRDTAPLAGLTDAGIAIAAALALFVIPVDMRRVTFAMDWESASRLPWGILLLFGGGLSLAAAIQDHGVGEWIGQGIGGLSGMPPLILLTSVVTLVIFLTELTSNTASTATLVPILASLAPALAVDPLLLCVPAAVAASCAFMLPVATPPNAIVFGSGRIRIPHMVRAGLWLNLIGIAVITWVTWGIALPLLRG